MLIVCAGRVCTRKINKLRISTERSFNFIFSSSLPRSAAPSNFLAVQLPILCPRFVDNSFGPARVEYPAAAKARHGAGNLRRCAAILLDPFNHLLDELRRQHAMAAHSRKLEHGGIRQLVDATTKTHGILDAV